MALNKNKQPHFVLFPYMAQGHMIPMVDIARLLAAHGVIVTILFTPLNCRRIKPVIDRAVASGLIIHISILEFPCAKAGLPEGCENFDMLPSIEDGMKFYNCASMLKDEVEDLLKELKPTCLISDMCFPWTAGVAQDLHIPRIVFHGTGCFPLVMLNMLDMAKTVDAMPESYTEYFVVPDLPDRIEITKAQLRGNPKELPSAWDEISKEIKEADEKTFGTLFNTFEELEPKYIDQYAKIKGTRVWCIGPVSLCNRNELDKAERGNKASITERQCLEWLDSREPGSVVYACLGSLSRVSSRQLIELGSGLEASNRPFIWVVRDVSDEFNAWLKEEDFEERVKKRPGGPGLLINGWAPQVLILSHPSVGAFVTHCGWNSTMEGVTAGVPMVTWPVFAEQFSNEKFIVNVIKTGVSAGVEMPVPFGLEEEATVQVSRDQIRMGVDEVMDGGDEGEDRRERARKFGEMAKRAMADGGSSHVNITRFIQDVQERDW